jgi:hypothetical protein
MALEDLEHAAGVLERGIVRARPAFVHLVFLALAGLAHDAVLAPSD